MKGYIDALIAYALERGLIQPGDEIFAFNRLLEIMGLDGAEDGAAGANLPLHEILAALTDDAARRGLVDDNVTALYHPHPDKHHIKKENIGLIEVMGLAVLPARLKRELEDVKTALLSGADLRLNERTAAHADWAEETLSRRGLTPENADGILRQEVGAVFLNVLEDAGVFKRDAAGKAAFLRFISCVNGKETA